MSVLCVHGVFARDLYFIFMDLQALHGVTQSLFAGTANISGNSYDSWSKKVCLLFGFQILIISLCPCAFVVLIFERGMNNNGGLPHGACPESGRGIYNDN